MLSVPSLLPYGPSCFLRAFSPLLLRSLPHTVAAEMQSRHSLLAGMALKVAAVLQSAEEAEGQGVALKAEVASLSAQLRQSEEALKASQERYLRLTADFDNFRKRSVSISQATQTFVRQQVEKHVKKWGAGCRIAWRGPFLDVRGYGLPAGGNSRTLQLSRQLGQVNVTEGIKSHDTF